MTSPTSMVNDIRIIYGAICDRENAEIPLLTTTNYELTNARRLLECEEILDGPFLVGVNLYRFNVKIAYNSADVTDWHCVTGYLYEGYFTPRELIISAKDLNGFNKFLTEVNAKEFVNTGGSRNFLLTAPSHRTYEIDDTEFLRRKLVEYIGKYRWRCNLTLRGDAIRFKTLLIHSTKRYLGQCPGGPMKLNRGVRRKLTWKKVVMLPAALTQSDLETLMRDNVGYHNAKVVQFENDGTTYHEIYDAEVL